MKVVMPPWIHYGLYDSFMLGTLAMASGLEPLIAMSSVALLWKWSGFGPLGHTGATATSGKSASSG